MIYKRALIQSFSEFYNLRESACAGKIEIYAFVVYTWKLGRERERQGGEGESLLLGTCNTI